MAPSSLCFAVTSQLSTLDGPVYYDSLFAHVLFWQARRPEEHTSCKPGHFGFNSIMSKLEQVEDQVKRLSIAEQEALRDWLDNLLEDRLELKDEFKAEIEAGQKDIAEGRYRIHRP
jgi:uncharacterized protein YdcH (DUF465 family)